MNNNNTKSIVGIDKLHLTLNTFNISSNTKLEINRANVTIHGELKPDHVLWTDETGQQTFGKKAFCNSNGIIVDLYPSRKKLSKRIVIKFSPATVLYTENYDTVPCIDLDRALTTVQGTMVNKMGVGCDINSSAISRIDIQSTIEFKTSINPIFDVLSNYKTVNRMSLVHGCPTGLLWKNSQKQLTIYDKAKQMGGDYVLEGGYKKALRIEFRLMNSQAVNRVLGITTVDQLTQNIIDKAFTNVVQPLINKAAPQLKSIPLQSLEDKIDTFMDNDNNKIKSFFEFYGIKTLLEEYGRTELTDIIKSKINKASTCQRHTRKIIDIYNKINCTDSSAVPVEQASIFETLNNNLFGNKGVASDFTGSLLCT